MFQKPFLFAIILSLGFVTGCIIPGARREKAEIELQRNDSLFVIDEGEFNFRIVLPKDLMISHVPVFHHNPSENTLSMTCGPSFHLIAEVSDPTMGPLPAQDGIFRLEVIDNEDQSTVYKRVLPDGVVYDYGLVQHTEINGVHYLFHTDSNAEYTLQDALRMKSALASIKI